MNVKDPFNLGFFKALNEFEKVSAFVNNPLNPLKRIETGQCPLCGKLYRLLEFHYECASCGICYCEQCTCTKGTTPRYCDICAALTSKKCRIHDFPGLAKWISLNYKKNYKKLSSHTAAIMFLTHMIGTKDTKLHNHVATVTYRYLPVIMEDSGSSRLLHSLHRHFLKCTCESKAIALDSFISLELQQINPVFDLTGFDLSLFLSKSVDNERTGARLIYALAKGNAIDLSQAFVFDLLKSQDPIILSFVLGSYANISPVPMGMEIHTSTIKETIYQNGNDFINILLPKLDKSQPYAVFYFAFIIILRIIQAEGEKIDLLKYSPNVFFEATAQSIDMSQKNNVKFASVAAFASQIIILLWKYAHSINNSDYLSQLFNGLLQILVNIMEINIPYDPQNELCVMQVIFVELIELISKDDNFGFAVKSEQITSFVNRIKNEMTEKPPKPKRKSIADSLLLGGEVGGNDNEEEEEDNLEAKEAEVAAQKQTIKDLEEINRRMSVQIEALSAELMDVSTEAEDEAAKALEDAEAELENVEAQIESLESELENEVDFCNKLKTQILEEETRTNASELEQKRVEREIAKQNEFLDQLKNKIISISNEIEKSTEAHQDQAISETETDLNEKRKEISLITEKSTIAESDLEIRKEQTKELRKKLMNTQIELQEKNDENASIRAKVQQKLSEAQSLEQRAKETTEAAKSMKDELSNSSTLTEIEERILSLEQTTSEVEHNIKYIDTEEGLKREKHNENLHKINEEIETVKTECEAEISKHRDKFAKDAQNLVQMWAETAKKI